MRSPFKKVIDETDLSRRDLAEILGCDLEVLNQLIGGRYAFHAYHNEGFMDADTPMVILSHLTGWAYEEILEKQRKYDRYKDERLSEETVEKLEEMDL